MRCSRWAVSKRCSGVKLYYKVNSDRFARLSLLLFQEVQFCAKEFVVYRMYYTHTKRVVWGVSTVHSSDNCRHCGSHRLTWVQFRQIINTSPKLRLKSTAAKLSHELSGFYVCFEQDTEQTDLGIFTITLVSETINMVYGRLLDKRVFSLGLPALRHLSF